MEAKQLIELKEKIERKKNQKARIEGSIEQIQKQLKSDHELEEGQVQNRVNDIDKTINQEKLKLKSTEEELDKIVDWNLL